MAIKWSAFSSGTAIQDADTAVGIQGGANVKWLWSAIKTYIYGAATAVLSITAAKTVTHTATTTFAGTDGKTLTVSNSGTLAGGDAWVLSITGAKTLSVANSLTFTGTDATSFAFPSTSGTVVTLGATQTLTDKTLTAPTMTTPVLGAASATSLSFSSTSGVIGTTTNNAAAAGSVGEYVTAAIAAGSAVALTTVTTANVTSISLTAGDWDVWGVAYFVPDTTTIVVVALGCISIVNGTTLNQASGEHGAVLNPGGTNGQTFSAAAGPYRLSLSGTTTVYLNAFAGFSVSTLAAWGRIAARRVR